MLTEYQILLESLGEDARNFDNLVKANESLKLAYEACESVNEIKESQLIKHRELDLFLFDAAEKRRTWRKARTQYLIKLSQQ